MFLFVEGFALAFGEFLVFSKVSGTGFDLIAHSVPFLQYNEKGQSRGIATVIFKSAASASKAVEKYNGAPIDGGKSKLRLELIIDPTKKPLISRIVANAPAKKEQPKKANVKKEQPKKADQKKKKENKPKNKRPVKKTIEQLDQEMADYFEKK
ncbi:RNA annealing protein YRA1 [Cyberlindnera fabianii]|uniref:RNA annealing protein YRA1 n=1 Tax=Cyberlindnera fabianii TaxID=36022 RepID=A0A1V2LCT3_CYBFA|nr:RNA annealing protein YRA1 [Cyberlindnera fabianii]